jgi:2-(1,2-epoxy-1,2-dihydrophenyl)acetyl-CoA isomerase
MITDILRVAIEGRVATVTMNRPESKNALNAALVEALASSLGALAENAEVGCIVLTGAGEAFCSGADLKEGMANPEIIQQIDTRLDRYHDIIRSISRGPKPVIAAVDGAAVGFGCDLALACDLRFLSERAYLQEKFVRIGLIPDGGGTLWLAQMIGMARAMEYILTGEAIDAKKAEALGLCNRVLPPGELQAAAHELAKRIAAGPPLANAGIKRAVRIGLHGDVDKTLATEKETQLRCLRSSDFMEGTLAWMQKRDPKFTGQ